MSELYRSLSIPNGTASVTWCSCPKRRRKIIFGQIRRQLGAIFHSLARQKECPILEGHLMPDHVHMYITIPPQAPGGFGDRISQKESAIAIARLCGKERNFSGEHFLGPGLRRSTVGFELE